MVSPTSAKKQPVTRSQSALENVASGAHIERPAPRHVGSRGTLGPVRALSGILLRFRTRPDLGTGFLAPGIGAGGRFGDGGKRFCRVPRAIPQRPPQLHSIHLSSLPVGHRARRPGENTQTRPPCIQTAHSGAAHDVRSTELIEDINTLMKNFIWTLSGLVRCRRRFSCLESQQAGAARRATRASARRRVGRPPYACVKARRNYLKRRPETLMGHFLRPAFGVP